ncbi:hypothetical protein GCM10007920_19620 [Ciceribacter naphthalenivorans]|uniref:Murein endopeptidase K n=2 Tax=Alphaproteobacteria TaxID=28211 RepID=A0A512HKV6_9HYPH|nr:hypothetical protein RNA01_30200 [Ciceribacter naphthalenivorans]GLR22175.1 hypothetical protein GCM10007920_19620 [Ciceribacter naphthalenivorans]GLT05031.1 hypothetical protein GCM10007926_19620 [Sphingomonas psychrolutea]
MSLLSVVSLFLLSCMVLFGTAASASAETRSLKIHFVHTGEKAEIVFKRNGRYDPKGLKQLSYLVRDWRRNEPTRMDPRLFDLVWEVYRRAGGSGYINVVSGYRSPATNAMLRSRSKGVAKESQHMKGTAMDFYIPGVQLKTLREIGMKLQAGGVGYYPSSRSPFVHMDVAGVRAWPRMSRQELVRLFPDGKTVHIPSDGKPLPGYQQALADYKKRLGSNQILIAEDKSGRGKRKNLLAMLFGGGDEDEDEDVGVPSERPSIVQQPVVTAAQPVMVATAAPPPRQAELTMPTQNLALNAPVPAARPSLAPADNSLAVALYSPTRNPAQDALSKVAAADPAAEEGFADLQTMKIPVPTLLGPRGMKGDADEANVMTASVDPALSGSADGQLSTVPVPIARPAVAEALLAGAESEPEAEIDEIEQAILSPEAAAALEESNMPMPATRPQAQPSSVAVLEDKAPKNEAPQVEVASVYPQAKPAKVDGEFGDGFDMPKPAAGKGLEAGLPTKGKRPSQAEAETARMAMTGGRLTEDMISYWALNQDHFEKVEKSNKAPRVVSRSLIVPTAALPVGFQRGTVSVDPSRFGAP